MINKEEQSTLERIHSSAKQEFLEKGFRAASLRNIVKTAGVTTGAFYGYYGSKEELFDAMVGEHAEYIMQLFDTTINDFEKLSSKEQTLKMVDVSENTIICMLDYIYQNYDEFKLIILCADGTKYVDFVHQLVAKEEESTCSYIEILKRSGINVGSINNKLIHMVASGLFTGIFETIVHDMPKEEAKSYILQLERFYSAGWEELLGVKFGSNSK